MNSFQLIAVAGIFGFVLWLFFNNKKTKKTERYTDLEKKNTLNDFDKMLGNIKQKKKDEIIELSEENEYTEDLVSEPDNIQIKDKRRKNKKNEDSIIDLKNAIISNEVLNKKKSKH